MGAMMRAHDWSNSPLGEPMSWPQSLRSVVGLLLGSKFPMFVAWGAELGFLYNDPYTEVLGAKHPSALGARFHDIWREIWPDISPLIDAAMSGQASYHENLPLLMNRKGYDEQTYFTFSYSPVRDESGKVAGMFCACTETTAQVLSARRTADERERLRRMFEQAPGMIAMLSGPEHIFEIANDKYLELVGRRDIIGKPIREALPEIAAQGFTGLLDNVFQSGEPYLGEAVPVRVEREPGGPLVERLVDFIYQPMTDDAGRISGVFVQANDVTASREAEKRLRDSEERYRQIVEGAEEFAIVSLDATGVIKSWNTGAERVTGFSEADAIGQPGAIIFTPEDRAAGAPESEMRRAEQAGRVANERWHVRKDGGRFWGSGLTMRLDAAGGGFLKSSAIAPPTTKPKRR
jgi:PAS domain S-box-containing protein